MCTKGAATLLHEANNVLKQDLKIVLLAEGMKLTFWDYLFSHYKLRPKKFLNY